jgi:hypothetical protein
MAARTALIFVAALRSVGRRLRPRSRLCQSPFALTYSPPRSSKDGGRANQYLDFVRDELIPRVAKTYRTTDYRILYGTSNTGFTAVHALFRTPDLADAYIAASATLSVPSFKPGETTWSAPSRAAGGTLCW